MRKGENKKERKSIKKTLKRKRKIGSGRKGWRVWEKEHPSRLEGK